MFIKIKYSLHLFSYILILWVLDEVQELVLKTDKNQGDFNAGKPHLMNTVYIMSSLILMFKLILMCLSFLDHWSICTKVYKWWTAKIEVHWLMVTQQLLQSKSQNLNINLQRHFSRFGFKCNTWLDYLTIRYVKVYCPKNKNLFKWEKEPLDQEIEYSKSMVCIFPVADGMV